MNIPFEEALAQMSNYVKVMKETMSNKRKLDDYGGTVSLSEKCSVIIQKKTSREVERSE